MLKIRLLPIIDHNYEPLINPKHLRFSLRKKKLNCKIEEQLRLFNEFKYQSEHLNSSSLATNNLKGLISFQKLF